MNNHLFFIAFLFAILTTSFVGQNYRVYSYVFDNENFTEQHCINKNLPESCCKGSCQMRNMADKDSTDTPSQTPEIKTFDLYLESLCLLSPSTYFKEFKKNFFVYQLELLKRSNSNLPPPPDVFCF